MRVAFIAGTVERHLRLSGQPSVLSPGCDELNDTTRHLQWCEKKTGLETRPGESVLNHNPAVLDGPFDGCINAERFTERLEIFERRPEFGRVVVLVDCDVCQLMNEHIHGRVYILLVQADVNLVPFIDVVAYGASVHPRPMDSGEDTPFPEASESRINHLGALEVSQERVVPLTKFRHERRFTATAPRGNSEGHDEQSRLNDAGHGHPTDLGVEKQTVHKCR